MKHLICVSLLLASLNSIGQVTDKKIDQWKDLKFSMFIHWGLYSELGGVWEGKPVTKGLSEQIQAHAGIYSDVYEDVAKRFNPVKWNADSIASLAKSAGMRSIVMTAKHHDGFCMFESKYTEFDVVDATPFKRDAIKEMSSACAKLGLRFGIYFSLIDWHYPQASPISSHNSDFITAEHHEYNKKQVTELLTNYGTISELWFDMGSQSAQQSKELADLVHRLQPGCLVSSRIGNDMGDFIVMGDNQEPNYNIDVPWQSPASFFDETWGYRSWQIRGDEDRKAKEKLSSLIRVVSRGGNYLLNIGPRGDGSVVEFEKNVLLKIGRWLNDNSEAIYGTRSDPFQVPFEWGSITRRDDKLYLHILLKPNSQVITLPGVKGKIERSYLMTDGVDVGFSQNDQEIQIQLPSNYSFDAYCTVVVLKFQKDYMILPPNQLVDSNGRIVLTFDNSFKHYSSSCIDYNTRFQSTTCQSWYASPKSSGLFTPTLQYTESEVGKVIALVTNGTPDSVILDKRKPLHLSHGELHWGTPVIAGPFFSSLEGSEGKLDNISVDKPWVENSAWTPVENWKSGDVYELPAGRMTAYYLLHEVVSSKRQSIVVSITAGDGLVVFVNGKERFIHLNTTGNKDSRHTILIPLVMGKNQILIKLFNNFQKQIRFSVQTNPDQIIYQKQLSPVNLKTKDVNTIQLKLFHPVTPHQDTMLRNVSVEFTRQ